jgi:hypothetical protein
MYYRIFIVIFISLIALYLLILGYNEKDMDYRYDYVRTVGKIIEKKIESSDEIESKKNNFKHIKKFRLKNLYTYRVKNQDRTEKEYTGYFYNDGNNDKFLSPDEYIPIGNMYKYVKLMNVYYNKEKPYDSCVKFEEIKNRKKKVYYILSVMMIFIIPIIIFV